jgi:acyl-CoA dehydrogenase
MVNHETSEAFFSDLEIRRKSHRRRREGFRYILDGLNAERALIAAECIGDARWFIAKATTYANERVVFDRPIGRNQACSSRSPSARSRRSGRSHALARRARCSTTRAVRRGSQHGEVPGGEASWEAANVCLQTHGGFGFAAEYDVERKFRETRLYQVAPVSTNLILSYVAEHVLGLPRSF